MARPFNPPQIFRYYASHLSRSSQDLIQRSFHGGDGLSSNSVVSSKASLLSSFSYRSPSTPFAKSGFQRETLMTSYSSSLVSTELKCPLPHLFRSARVLHPFFSRSFSTTEKSAGSTSLNSSSSISDFGPRIKFKRLDKTSRHIMQILDKEAVEEVKSQREIPDIRPGYIVQLKVEVPENKRRVSTLKGIVIARRNAGLNTTFRIRRLVAGVGVESLFPLYSPNIKEIKVLDKKKVRRAKLYYLRDKMNALKKQ